MGYHLQKLLNKGFEIFIDIPNYNNPGNLFSLQRPDIVLKLGNKIYCIELTVCFETNFEKSRNYKKSKYENLGNYLTNRNWSLEKIFFVEFSSLGFCSKEMINLNRFLRNHEVDVKRMIKICSEVCIRTSYYLFNRRSKDWTVKELIKYQ